ncbi:hypothetical protein [Geothrix sp. PMB-07]|uniref:hypothetical protein n=1 Tax=Geothrix sp. PMB-07 TaxID=3068640 RepID=UPI002741F2F4|nr:hypothetical protein [Geothrix sp. PMB-07]WLT32755.1 hypothetical protein Q9293_05335 [Geothrix sp. PMB-07]
MAETTVQPERRRFQGQPFLDVVFHEKCLNCGHRPEPGFQFHPLDEHAPGGL